MENTRSMPIDNHPEKRSHERVLVFSDAWLEQPGTAKTRVFVDNVSRDGIGMCKVPPEWTLAQGEEVRVHLRMVEDCSVIFVAGKVVWREADRLGIQFLDARVTEHS